MASEEDSTLFGKKTYDMCFFYDSGMMFVLQYTVIDWVNYNFRVLLDGSMQLANFYLSSPL